MGLTNQTTSKGVEPYIPRYYYWTFGIKFHKENFYDDAISNLAFQEN